MNEKINAERAQEELEKGYAQAEALLKDTDKVEKLLQKLERKFKEIPIAGNALANLPVMVSLVRSYIKKQYTDIPIGTIIAVVSSIAYVVSPIDLIPDFIPFVGYLDDAAVIAACWKLVRSDIKDYEKWRRENRPTAQQTIEGAN